MTAYSWNSSNPGNWSTAGDWTPGGGPPSTSADSATLSFSGITLDVNETIGALTIGSAADILDIGSNQLTVTNAGGLAGTVTVTAGNITIGGGTLSATNGISMSVGTRLLGSGTLIGTIAGAGAYVAEGTLRLEGAILASATDLELLNTSTPSVLELDSTVASGVTIKFGGSNGTLELTDISAGLLQGFGGTIVGLTVSSSATVPTNQIDLAGLATANISAASLNTSTGVLTVTTTGGSFTLQLQNPALPGGTYAPGTFVYWIADSAGTGSDLFLSDLRQFSWNAASASNWSNAANWTPSGGPPGTSADAASISATGSAYTVTLDASETIGRLSIGSGNATLAIGSNQLTVANDGGWDGTVTVTAGNITIGGGTLTATGFSLSAGTSLSGSGELFGTIAGAGEYEASGGTLVLRNAVLASATDLAIANTSASILRLDSTVASGAGISFLGTAGTLQLNDISGSVLQGFSGTIAGLNVGSSVTVPTNQIDLFGLAKANVSAASLNRSTDVLTVTTTGGSFTLQLSGSYAAGTFVDWITDGPGGIGIDLFLVAEEPFSWKTAVSGNWSTAADWTPSGGPPNTSADTASITATGSPYTVTLNVSETVGALTIDGSNATLAIGGNQLTVANTAGGAGTVTVTHSGTITIGGGTLSATNGFSLSSATSLSGSGTLIGTIAGAGAYQASGGTLRLESAVSVSATGLQIANTGTSVLRLDNTVASAAKITFLGAAGTLDLTDISGSVLHGFSGTIAGLNVGSGATVPTNQIDLAGLAKANISAASLDTSADKLNVTTTGGLFTLQLSGSYAAGTQVGLITDGAGTGTDLFLFPANEFSWSAASSGNWSSAAAWTPSGGPPNTSADGADISVAGSYTVTLDVNETIGALTIRGGAGLAIGGNQLTVTNASSLAGTVTVTSGFITIAGGTLSATNGFSVASGSVLQGYGALIGTIAGAGNGNYQAIGGTLRLESAVGNSATGLHIAGSGATLELDSTFSVGAVIDFAAPSGTLELTDISGNVLQGFSGTITGLNVGSSSTVPTNQIDLAGLPTADINAASLDTFNHVVTVTTTGGSFTLRVGGTYAAGTFVDWITDGAGTGSDLFLSSAACYCRGTMILTPGGEVAVEELALGGKLVTVSGEERPIRWIGQRAYDGHFITGNKNTLPICVRRDAIMKGVPARDLWVSPEHSLYIDDVLVQAKHMINGVTVVQPDSVDQVEYFHIELDSHDVIYADGALAETFVDCDNRLMFTNAADYAATYPDDERPRWQFCAPRLEWGSPELATIRECMFDRARQLGHVANHDPGLHLVVDGAVQSPTLVAGKVYRFALPPGCGAVWLRSQSVVPAEWDAASRDIRRLGVPLERLVLSDADVSIEAWHGHPAFRDGFYDDENTQRWTDGHARIPDALLRPFPDGVTLEVHLAGNLRDMLQAARAA